eukprot:m.69263 g.69263  ORF g.69263 m.69263 type:complete len:268 (+) comp8267_c0_seq15:946-1749(+)
MIPFCVKTLSLCGNKEGDSVKTIFEEHDHRYFVDISKSKDGAFVFINSNRKDSSEIRVIPSLSATTSPLQVVVPRDDCIYFMEHWNGWFYFLTNADGAVNFKLVRAPASTPQKEYWECIVPHSDSEMIRDGEILEGHFVLHCANMTMEEYLLTIDLESLEAKYHRPKAKLGWGKLSFSPAFDRIDGTFSFQLQSDLPTGDSIQWKYDFISNQTLGEEVTLPPNNVQYFDPSQVIPPLLPRVTRRKEEKFFRFSLMTVLLLFSTNLID